MSVISFSVLLAHALTGEDLPLAEFTTDQALLSDLDRLGWSPTAIREHAHNRQETAQAWPHPMTHRQMIGVSPAQWYATLTRIRARLGLDVDIRPPSRRTNVNADERRLLAEAPPHHGHVG
ncbi:MAG: hypothetical protein LBV00_03680 [Propionibacteriaceae bacterium]|nr:hypothetical protein [Propionibacteriaceae bacterium]